MIKNQFPLSNVARWSLWLASCLSCVGFTTWSLSFLFNIVECLGAYELGFWIKMNHLYNVLLFDYLTIVFSLCKEVLHKFYTSSNKFLLKLPWSMFVKHIVISQGKILTVLAFRISRNGRARVVWVITF